MEQANSMEVSKTHNLEPDLSTAKSANRPISSLPIGAIPSLAKKLCTQNETKELVK